MKKILSAVLALVMVLATFTMLVPSVAATTSATAYEQDFDSLNLATGADAATVLSAIGWSASSTNAANAPEVIVDPTDANNYVIHLETEASKAGKYAVINDTTLSDGFVITYEFKFVDTDTANEFVGFMGNAGNYGAYTWHARFYANGTLMNTYKNQSSFPADQNSGAESFDASAGWYTVRIEGSQEKGIQIWAHQGKKDSVPQNLNEWSVRSSYTAAELTAATALQSFMTGNIGFWMGFDVNIYLDSITIAELPTTTEEFPAAYGVQTGTISVNTESKNSVRLLGLIDNEIFGRADAVGFRVTMTKAGAEPVTKDIFCNYVYSSITEWGTDTPTQPSEMKSGASHIYALHIHSLTEDVTINFTAIYRVGGDNGSVYEGTASSTVQYTASSNTVAVVSE
ncbi:MAG: hypothetical protein IJY47_06590 [Clostridia bacterium]|nr:hypothetical protein [Clostridia bacterium]